MSWLALCWVSAHFERQPSLPFSLIDFFSKGLTVSYFSYLQFFPALSHSESFIPLSRFGESIQINENEERERLFVDEEAGVVGENR